jgi:hypothetical protein
MSAKTKTRAQKVGKFLGITLFALLMFFNIKFAISDDSNGDIDLFGLKVSVFTNSTYAYGDYGGWGWLNTGYGSGPDGSTYFICCVPLQSYECGFGGGGWGF